MKKSKVNETDKCYLVTEIETDIASFCFKTKKEGLKAVKMLNKKYGKKYFLNMFYFHTVEDVKSWIDY